MLLSLEIADPVNLPPVSLTCTSVTINPVMNWSWQDTQVVAFPGMLHSLNGKLEEHVDLQYPCHRSLLQLDYILEEVVPIEDENNVHSRLANTLSYGIKALVRHGMALESKFAIQMDSPNSGPVQPDIEVLVDGHCRWLIEAKRNLVAGPVIKALYNAAASSGPFGAGFLVQRKDNSNDVDLTGYQGANAETLGKILKQVSLCAALHAAYKFRSSNTSTRWSSTTCYCPMPSTTCSVSATRTTRSFTSAHPSGMRVYSNLILRGRM
jgi:hypothetical protein